MTFYHGVAKTRSYHMSASGNRRVSVVIFMNIYEAVSALKNITFFTHYMILRVYIRKSPSQLSNIYESAMIFFISI